MESPSAEAGPNVVPLTEKDREFLCRRIGLPAARVLGCDPQTSPTGQLELFPLPFDPLHPGPAEAEWSRRYMEFARQYVALDCAMPAAMAVVIDGLHAWLRMLPQRSRAANGAPQSANAWGLGAERCFLRSLNSHLVAGRDGDGERQGRLVHHHHRGGGHHDAGERGMGDVGADIAQLRDEHPDAVDAG